MARTLELLDGVSELSAQQWNPLVGGGSPFLEWDWLASLEESGCVRAEHGWQAKPLVVREGDALVAACPVYLKSHSEGEFVFDWGWADAAERAGIRYYPKLLVGVPFTPVTGTRFLTGSAQGEDRRSLVQLMAGALREICRNNEFSSVHVNFCLDEEARVLEDDAYHLRVGLQYHWRNAGYGSFDDYLGQLRSKRRNQVRRERRRVAEQGARDHSPPAPNSPKFGTHRHSRQKKGPSSGCSFNSASSESSGKPTKTFREPSGTRVFSYVKNWMLRGKTMAKEHAQ